MALLIIVSAMGTAFYFVDRNNTRAYYDELSQSLNAPIAMYVTQQRQLIESGAPDLDGLQELAGHAMVINPTAEIYLLDAEGRVLGHSLGDDVRVDQQIDLEPVQALIAGDQPFPIRGDDPRNADVQKIFSAWPVTSAQGTEGYVYVVLGGQKYEELASNIGDSYVARESLYAIAALVLLTAIVGWLVFALLTRRLKKLTREIRRVTQAHFEEEPQLEAKDGGDEIDQLAGTFAAMSAQIRSQIDQLTENDRLRRELVSNISHDLRTPLTAMQGYIETLILKGDAMEQDDRDHYLRIAQKHSVRLGRLIGDLFELSKLDAASVTPHVESFSMAELVQDIAQEFRIETERKRVDLKLEVDSTDTLTLGDIGLIQRVLENLVRNAVQFAPEGGEVKISIAQRPATLAVAVSDNGPGIADDDVPRIFDRFWRARDGEEARSNSSGLGLAIVKRILDLHNARITVSSKLNRGTRFEFELPISRQAA